MKYLEFLKNKESTNSIIGFQAKDLNQNLFDFQKHIVTSAVKKGRYAIFADCGLGKTLMQLEISKQCALKTKRPSLILSPLAVVEQTKKEGLKFNIECDKNNIDVFNYEQLKNIDVKKYGCVCLDESSILKNFQGKTKTQLIDSFYNTPFRFCFTATPSPNDTMELGNHAEFLGQMKYKNMLSMYFINDMDSVQKWRLKGHAENPFWKWVSSWSVCLTNPNEMGFFEQDYTLPNLNFIDHKLDSEKIDNGLLFNHLSVSSTNHNRELKRTFDLRMEKTVHIANSHDRPTIVWCKHNDESTFCSKNIIGAREVTGSMSDRLKTSLLLGFADGDFRVLVTKPKIGQYGLNYQHCGDQIFPSPDFSFEGLYQSIRRSYRFGRKDDVNINLITTDTMQNVVEAIRRKQEQFKTMQRKLSKYGANIPVVS